MMRTKASILVGLLWCLALLSVVVITVLHTARLDLVIVKNYGDRIQAHYLALAGIEKAKALLFQDAKIRSRNGKNHTGELQANPQQFRDVAFGRGHFRVFRRGRTDEGGGIIYGVTDEESRLNVNSAPADQLEKLYGMTPDVAAAIIDWRDDDNVVTPGGAEAEYYSSLQPPSLPRNGPFQTLRELLMVRGVSRELLLGKDTGQNGLLDDEREDGNNSSSDLQDGVIEDAGWSALLTVDSSIKNLNAAGDERVNIQTADERSLTGIKGITAQIARAIIAHRNQNQFKSVADLLDVTAAQNQNASRPGANQASQSARNGQSANSQGATGPRVVDENLLQDIWLTVWTKAGLFDSTRASARTWVFALARHALIDLKRAQQREHGVFETYFAEHAADCLDERHAERIDGDRTVAVLQQLAPEQAQVLVMAYVEGKSHREIARELGLPIGTVKSRVRLGFTRVRTLLEGST